MTTTSPCIVNISAIYGYYRVTLTIANNDCVVTFITNNVSRQDLVINNVGYANLWSRSCTSLSLLPKKNNQ
ncbi:hypothetical protein O9992_21865 [Vibrio lentus]|nr:hypothetical protein [Vibrio lentus]